MGRKDYFWSTEFFKIEYGLGSSIINDRKIYKMMEIVKCKIRSEAI